MTDLFLKKQILINQRNTIQYPSQNAYYVTQDTRKKRSTNQTSTHFILGKSPTNLYSQAGRTEKQLLTNKGLVKDSSTPTIGSTKTQASNFQLSQG